MRRFSNNLSLLLAGTVAACLLSASLSGCAPVQTARQPDELVIYHTNDLHTHFAGNDKRANACVKEENCTGGYGQVAFIIEEARKNGENFIFLDAGDRLQGSLFYTMKKWRVASEFDNLLGFDAATLGNHEFDEGCGELAKYISESNSPILAANLQPGVTCPLHNAPISKSKIIQAGNIRVGVIGLASSLVYSGSRACPGTLFTDPKKTAREEIDKLRAQGVDVVVLLSHLGMPLDIELAGMVKGADIIVGGHSHTYLGKDSPDGAYPTVINSADDKPVLMVTTNGLARYLGKLTVKVSPGHGVKSWEGSAIELGAAGGNKEISDLIRQNEGELTESLGKVIGENAIVCNDGFDACRHGSCLTAELAADLILEHGRSYGAQIAFINGGTVRNSLPVGKVTAGDLVSAMPFEDVAEYHEYTGAQLLLAIEHSVADSDGVGPRLLQGAGIEYTYDPKASLKERLISVRLVDPDGTRREIDPNAKYIVGLNSYIANGGNDYQVFRQGRVVARPGTLVLDLMKKRFAEHKVLTQRPLMSIIQRTAGQ